MKRGSENGRKHKMNGAQAAILLLVFCVPAVFAAVLLWKGIHYALEYYDRDGEYDLLIETAAVRNGVDPALLKAVIWKESRFDRYVIGSKGEIGLMQIMPQFAVRDWSAAHRRKIPSDGALSDPELNIEIGSWYLGRALRRWRGFRECTALALGEYNAGFQRAVSWKPELPDGSVLDRIDIASTSAYITAILAKQKTYAREFREEKDSSK